MATSGTGGGGGISRRDLLKSAAALGAAWIGGGPFTARAEGSMNLRGIPSSGEKIPVIGLGTWQTFDEAPDTPAAAACKEVLRRFQETGGRVVDSSPMYGRAEALVGDLTQELGISHDLFIATKVWTRGRQSGIEEMDRSFKLLRRRTLDLMQVHNLVDVDTQLATMRTMKAAGRLRYVGITHYTVSAYDDLMRLMNRRDHPLDFVQFNFNIATREAERRLLPLAAERGIATLINEPFEKGSLFRAVRGHSLPDWAAEFDCGSWAQFFLKYIVSHPAVTCAIPATADPEHVVDNTRAGFGKLPDPTQRKRMASYFDSL